jgi:hypothetical protein
LADGNACLGTGFHGMSDLTGLNEFTRVLNIINITTTNSSQIERKKKKRKDILKEI